MPTPRRPPAPGAEALACVFHTVVDEQKDDLRRKTEIVVNPKERFEVRTRERTAQNTLCFLDDGAELTVFIDAAGDVLRCVLRQIVRRLG